MLQNLLSPSNYSTHRFLFLIYEKFLKFLFEKNRFSSSYQFMYLVSISPVFSQVKKKQNKEQLEKKFLKLLFLWIIVFQRCTTGYLAAFVLWWHRWHSRNLSSSYIIKRNFVSGNTMPDSFKTREFAQIICIHILDMIYFQYDIGFNWKRNWNKYSSVKYNPHIYT